MAVMMTPGLAVSSWDPERDPWPSLGGVACEWLQDCLVHGPGPVQGEPYRLRRDQAAFIWRWFERHPESGEWRFLEALRGEARGGAKTELVAALACLELAGPPELSPPSPDVPVAAASYQQADILFSTAGIMLGGPKGVESRAPLCGLFDVFDSEIVRADGRPGRIYRVAAVAGTNEGGRATLLVGDELHEWHGRKERVATVLAASLRKRTPPGRALWISTAGAGRGAVPPEETDSLLWKMYAQGLEQRAHPERHPRYLFDWREADAQLDLADPEQRGRAVRQASGAADVIWRVGDRVDAWDDPKIPRHEWERYYANRWVAAGATGWLADRPGAWEACRSDVELPARVVLAVDAALYHDSTALVVAGRVDDVDVVRAQVWRAPPDGAIDLLDVMNAIRVLARERDVLEVAYDPRLFEVPASILADEGIPMVEIPQSHEQMAPAASHAYERIMSRGVAHDGDPVLAAHVTSAVRRPLADRGFVLSKSRSGKHIDAAIALVIALRRLEWHSTRKPAPKIRPRIW